MSLNISHVTKRFKSFTAVDDINLTLEKGKMLGFLGRNGAGKTTSFRMILGLMEPTVGEITYEGKPITSDMYDVIGYLPEERGLHPKLTVNEELTYLATLKGMKPKAIKQAIDTWLTRFEITENKDKKIESLSKGNQQKVQLLASILHEPELLILDEPFSGLDPVNVELLKGAVKELNANGSTIIFSSHRMEHVEELCDDICILNAGKMVVQGSIHEVKEAFGYKRVAIEADYDLTALAAYPGVVKYEQQGETTYLTIDDVAVAESLFAYVQQHGFVRRFQVLEPTINEIFIQKAGEQHV
ncbi:MULTISPECIES: ABC transporter ATP-binding protein [unclassified Staphylococcus]|uniref:ABC transporter ATP-binding protein n=1 Tax=unclassified Staphylococcus TaxID=91994 RepID=UPI0021D0C83D|nr:MULTISPECIES: ABC transporter ATP-binding protein [unclassified Staphylococcus]UXR78062.1 ABC transporter ATP-binding protein [Staphylococcus sp. IVB6227]UXR82225.1 ABC transporter ATP-binding protein [Staphylococcus sp. IVB6214]